jgi:hypothetical protein
MKLTDDYAAGNTDARKSPVDERYGLITPAVTRHSYHNKWGNTALISFAWASRPLPKKALCFREQADPRRMPPLF